MEVGENIIFGSYEWKVLAVEKEKVLLITKDIIEQRPYHNKKGDVTWEISEIRSYLNGEFYHSFDEEDQKRIVPVVNKNMDNEWYKTSGGKDTTDYIFLLSIEEVTCKYFGDSSRLLYQPGKNQRYWMQRKDSNNIYRRARFMDYRWWWWLRSPGRVNRTAVYVWPGGNIGIQGNGTFKYGSQDTHPQTLNNSGGVRPALWIQR
jgi:hypothetical protein